MKVSDFVEGKLMEIGATPDILVISIWYAP